MSENKEEIKNRMLRTAARIWGYPEINSENEFDPLISMLLHVNASELERLSQELSLSRARILERMMQIQTPETLVSAVPAHAIIHTESIENVCLLSTQTQLKLEMSNAVDKESDNAMFFAPTIDYMANRIKVQYVQIDRKLYQYKNNISKEIIAELGPQNLQHAHSVWLGLANVSGSIPDTQFYFHTDNQESKSLFYSSLGKCKWLLDGESSLRSHIGFQQNGAWQLKLDVPAVANGNDVPNSYYDKSINSYYEPYFVTVGSVDQQTLTKGNIPKAWESELSMEWKQRIAEESIVWVRLDFPEIVSTSILETVNYFANCLPVANKRLYDIVYKLDGYINVLPLPCEGNFFDMASVSDGEGNQIPLQQSRTENADQTLQALLRIGGVARFDERDAQATLQHLIQVLRDESAAFASLKPNFLQNEVKELQQAIYKLEKVLLQNHSFKEQSPHLLVTQLKSNEEKKESTSLFLQYWSTDGSNANGIRPDTRLIPYKSNDINYYHTFFVSGTRGGRNRLKSSEQINAYKYALISHDRILSKEDVRIYCKNKLGNALENVVIRSGVVIPSDPQSGYSKTIDVYLYIDTLSYLAMEQKGELAFWSSFLQKEIQNRSQTLTPYRVFLKENVNEYQKA